MIHPKLCESSIKWSKHIEIETYGFGFVSKHCAVESSQYKVSNFVKCMKSRSRQTTGKDRSRPVFLEQFRH